MVLLFQVIQEKESLNQLVVLQNLSATIMMLITIYDTFPIFGGYKRPSISTSEINKKISTLY
jgi:hypothetical protein